MAQRPASNADIAKLIDAVTAARADPDSVQIDELDRSKLLQTEKANML
jgi:hypothetical protein